MKDPVCTDEDAAKALNYTKSKPAKIKKGMEGERTGLPHLSPVSLRFRNAHAAVGTKVDVPSEM